MSDDRQDEQPRDDEARDETNDAEPESEPTPVVAPDTDPGAGPPAPAPRPLWWTVMQWALPVVLAAGAVGVHWWLNVPEKIVKAKGDQGSKQRKPTRRRRATYEPRSKAELERAYNRWHRVDFEGEPIHGKWARKYQPIVSKAVVVARRSAFEGAPGNAQVSVTNTECRTVRCRFVLRSPFEHELARLDAVLSHVEDKNGKVWKTYDSVVIEPPAEAPADQFYRQVVITFVTDEIDAASLKVPEGIEVPVVEASGGAPEGSGDAPDREGA